MPGNYHYSFVVGSVGRDPEKRQAGSSQVASFSVAVTESWNDRQSGQKREKTTWYSCSAWGPLADIVERYVKKGDNIMLTGRVSARAYTGNDGQPRASLDLRVDDMQLLGNRRDSQSGGGSSGGGGGNYDDFAPPPNDENDIPF